jgi:exopolysaccharide production protein ExoQ
MNSKTAIATVAYVLLIAGLYYLDRDRRARISKALWVPCLWLLIIGSRPVSAWFNPDARITSIAEYNDGSPLDAAVYGAIVLAGIVVLAFRSKKVSTYLRLNAPIILFFLYCAISIAWSDYSFISFKRWIKAIGDFIMVLVVLTDPDSETAIRKLLSRAAFVLLPLSVLFIKYYPDIGRSYDPFSWIPMYSGVTTFKNLLGETCMVCSLGSLWSFMGAWQDRTIPNRTRHLVAHGLLLVIAVWLFNIANSMTSLVTVVMTGTLICLTLQKRVATRIRVANLLMVGVIALSVCALFVDPKELLPSIGRDATLTGRTGIWQAVLAQNTNPLIGTGFESFWMGSRMEAVWDLTEKGIQKAHNGYLEMYLNLGFVGLSLLAFVIVTGYLSCMAVFRRNPHAGRIRLAFFTAGLIYSLTEAGFRMMSPVWLCFLLASARIPVPKRLKPTPQTARTPESVNEVSPPAVMA